MFLSYLCGTDYSLTFCQLLLWPDLFRPSALSLLDLGSRLRCHFVNPGLAGVTGIYLPTRTLSLARWWPLQCASGPSVILPYNTRRLPPTQGRLYISIPPPSFLEGVRWRRGSFPSYRVTLYETGVLPYSHEPTKICDIKIKKFLCCHFQHDTCPPDYGKYTGGT